MGTRAPTRSPSRDSRFDGPPRQRVQALAERVTVRGPAFADLHFFVHQTSQRHRQAAPSRDSIFLAALLGRQRGGASAAKCHQRNLSGQRGRSAAEGLRLVRGTFQHEFAARFVSLELHLGVVHWAQIVGCGDGALRCGSRSFGHHKAQRSLAVHRRTFRGFLIRHAMNNQRPTPSQQRPGSFVTLCSPALVLVEAVSRDSSTGIRRVWNSTVHT